MLPKVVENHITLLFHTPSPNMPPPSLLTKQKMKWPAALRENKSWATLSPSICVYSPPCVSPAWQTVAPGIDTESSPSGSKKRKARANCAKETSSKASKSIRSSSTESHAESVPVLPVFDPSVFVGRFFLRTESQIDEEILGPLMDNLGQSCVVVGEEQEDEEEVECMSLADAHKLGVVL